MGEVMAGDYRQLVRNLRKANDFAKDYPTPWKVCRSIEPCESYILSDANGVYIAKFDDFAIAQHVAWMMAQMTGKHEAYEELHKDSL